MVFLRYLVPALLLLMMSTCNGQVKCDVKPSSMSLPSHFYGHPNTTMMNEMMILEDMSRYECMQLCRRNATCVAFTYADDIRSCSMFDRDSETGLDLMQSEPGVWFYDMRNPRKHQQSYVGKCTHNGRQCHNGGSCINDCSDRGYYCACAEQFYGQHCLNAFVHKPSLVQTIIGPESWASIAFSHRNIHYLVIGGRSSDQTKVYTYVNTSGLYEYQQTIPDFGFAMAFLSFLIDDELYLFCAQYEDSAGSRSTNSYIYRIHANTGLLEQYQSFSTEGVYDGSHLRTTDGKHYLAVANYYGSSSHDTISQIYQWMREDKQFVLVGQMQSYGPKGVELFEISGVVYVAISNHRSDAGGYAVEAQIWKCEPSGTWSKIQDLPDTDQGSAKMALFEHESETYLVVVNMLNCVQNTIVFRWNQINNQFDIHQRIEMEHCPLSATVFKAGGHVFLAIGTLQQDGSGTDSANYDTSSQILKLEGSMFVRYLVMPARYTFQFFFYERDGEYFLTQTNKYNEDSTSKSEANFKIFKWI